MAKKAKTKTAKITLACTECKNRNYDTTKNTAEHPDRVELNKLYLMTTSSNMPSMQILSEFVYPNT